MTIEVTEQRDLLTRVLTDLHREFTAQALQTSRLAIKSKDHRAEWMSAALTWGLAAAIVEDRLAQEGETQQ